MASKVDEFDTWKVEVKLYTLQMLKIAEVKLKALKTLGIPTSANMHDGHAHITGPVISPRPDSALDHEKGGWTAALASGSSSQQN